MKFKNKDLVAINYAVQGTRSKKKTKKRKIKLT